MAESEHSNAKLGRVGITFDGDGIMLELSGEIDMSNVDSLRAKIEPVITKRPQPVTFDLHDLAFMDSSGIALLLQIAAQAQSVRVHRPSPLVRRMIEATGLTEILVIEP